MDVVERLNRLAYLRLDIARFQQLRESEFPHYRAKAQESPKSVCIAALSSIIDHALGIPSTAGE